MVDKDFWSFEEAQEAFPEYDFDELKDYEEEGGKHDCTNCFGHAFNADGTQSVALNYTRSYNNGVEWINVRGPYKVETEEVTITRYKYTALEA